ncbi:MAG: 16S rRNA (guanine(966)-N(2))-methyltransferase RsmD [Dissulfurispiraceae bacterium]
MRISGGIAKGRNMRTAKAFARKGRDEELRPTSAKVRKAIFDILGQRIVGSNFLDLYAGTGAVGIEALSRGSARVAFVEDCSVRGDAIRELTIKFGLSDRAVIFRDKTALFLKKHAISFDIIFIDPPYASRELDLVLPLLGKSAVLNDGGVAVVEHSSRSLLPPRVGRLALVKNYRYGDTSLSVYKKNAIAFIDDSHSPNP